MEPNLDYTEENLMELSKLIQMKIMESHVDAELLNPVTNRLFLVKKEENGAVLAFHLCDVKSLWEEHLGIDVPNDQPGGIAAWVAYHPERSPAMVATCVCSETGLTAREITAIRMLSI